MKELRSIGKLVILVVLCLAGTGARVGDGRYYFKAFDVPINLGDGTTAQGINGQNVIVGNFVRHDGSVDGFLFKDGRFTDVTVPGASPDYAGPLGGINDLRVAVGGFIDASTGIGHTFTIDRNGRISVQPDPTPDSVQSVGLGINNSGVIVGFYFDIAGIQHGFIQRGSISKPYNYPGAPQTVLTAINNRSQIVGFWIDPTFHFHGFLLDHGRTIPIQIPGSISVAPRGINDDGQIVGGYREAAGGRHGFLLDDDDFQQLDFPGATSTVIIGINNESILVGTYNDFTRGLIATPDH